MADEKPGLLFDPDAFVDMSREMRARLEQIANQLIAVGAAFTADNATSLLVVMTMVAAKIGVELGVPAAALAKLLAHAVDHAVADGAKHDAAEALERQKEAN